MSLTTDETNVDGCGYIALNVLFHKQLQRGCHLYPGNNFGEMCLLSQTGLRVDSALTVTNCEVYYVVKEDLAEVFRFIEPKNKQQFLFELASSCTISGSNGKECRPVVSSSEVDDVELSWNGNDTAMDELSRGFAAISESISSALAERSITAEALSSEANSSDKVTLTQVQTLLITASSSKRVTSLDDAMVINRKMRHSFSVESILNRKRNQAIDANSDDDEDESSVATSRRSQVLPSEDGVFEYSAGGSDLADRVKNFDEIKPSATFLETTDTGIAMVHLVRRYTIGVASQLFQHHQELANSRGLGEERTIPSSSWLQIMPSKSSPQQRRASF